MTLYTHRTILPSFGITQDQDALAVYTILSVNDDVRDCAAYRGIGPMMADKEMIERIKAGGNKIREEEARGLFDEIADMGLRYRK